MSFKLFKQAFSELLSEHRSGERTPEELQELKLLKSELDKMRTRLSNILAAEGLGQVEESVVNIASDGTITSEEEQARRVQSGDIRTAN